ncbi:uncharacterized protein LOC133199134 [Saccostrea echinata]|uniref:uncharacterized protein LOC133199134 n=1 Tax=Saccostrea echinata TaxID=191078 RepID=UPI002A7F7D0D|nr:uncharacterized protein LOC133199134 [Saccostrea echinata]
MYIYLLILLLQIDRTTYGILFEYRLRCPDTAEKWRENTKNYICHGDTVYHCMQDQDGHYVVFCAPTIWIQPDYCPEFNAKASLIDVILCQGATEKCPESVYLSNTVYQYPSCFRIVIRTTGQTKLGNEEQRTEQSILKHIVIYFAETVVPPRLYENAVSLLKETGFIIIGGGPGSGKTTLANYIVKEEFMDYNVHVMKPKQTKLPELTSDKGDVVVWDDCFGIWNVCDLEENLKTDIRNTIISLIDRCKGKENHKAMICIDSFFDEKQLIVKFKSNFVNISENYEFLTEREHLVNRLDRRIYVGNISEDVGFPLLVQLIAENYCQIEKSEEFMKNPILKLNENFCDLFKNERDVYVTLVYVLCNTPSVDQGDINWTSWTKLRDECESKDDDYNNPQQEKNNEYSQSREANQLPRTSYFIYRNPKCIKMNTTLTKYLENTENQDVFRFRHHFLARLLLRYHLEKVGNKGILEVGNEEIKSVVKKIQSSLLI